MNATPGPWHVPEFAPWQVIDPRHLTGTVIAQVHTDGLHGRNEAEAHANARLIAAAPDMVELIAEFVRYAGECMGDREDLGPCRGFNPRHLDEPCPWCKGMGVLDELGLLDREGREPVI